MKESLPMPEGMTQEKMEDIPVSVTKGWRKSDKFIHIKCGENALYHPYTNMIWGCKECNFFTYSSSLFFKPINDELVKELCGTDAV